MTDTDWGSEPSKRRQWNERPSKPTAARQLTYNEIEEFRLAWVQSYKCPDKGVRWEFKKITHEDNDVDIDDCLWLHYYHDCIRANVRKDVIIWSLKVPLPDNIRERDNAVRRQQASQGLKTHKLAITGK